MVTEEITALREQLAESDYRVLKQLELQCYSTEEYAAFVHERQVLRDKINALEAQLGSISHTYP